MALPPTFVRPFYVGAANRTVTKLEQIDADGAALRCPPLVTDGLVTTG